MVATAENTQMKQWRSTSADWASVNPVIGDGEFCWASDVKVLKMGDGSTPYNGLPKLYDGTLEFSDLTSAVELALANAVTAGAAAEQAATALSNATDAAQLATDNALASGNNANIARDYAQAPRGTPLPTGGDSCEVIRGDCRGIAQETRYLDWDDAPITGNFTFAAGRLFKEQDVTAAGLVTMTMPAGIHSSVDKKKAWSVFRLRTTTGSLKIQAAAGGDDLQPPPILASGRFAYRNVETMPGTGAPFNSTISVPAVTAGTLVLAIAGCWNNPSAISLTATADSGVTLTAKRAQVANPSPVIAPSWSVWTAPLTAFAADDVVITIDPSTNGQVIDVEWFVLEDTVGDPTIVAVTTASAASFAEATLTSLAAKSRVLAVAAQRAIASASVFSAFGVNITLINAGSTAGLPSTSVSDTNTFKNMQLARGTGVPATTADFTVRADFTAATDEAALLLLAFGPKTVTGAGDVTLELEGGRDTLTVDHGEMILKFLPDGKTVQVSTSNPAT